MIKDPIYNVKRTTEGTIFELVFMVVAVAVWTALVRAVASLPDSIPLHFGLNGEPDSYGSPTKLILPCVVLTVVALCVLAGAYFPKSWNLPVKLTTERQYLHTARLMRILALMLLLTVGIMVFTAYSLAENTPMTTAWPLLAWVAAMVLTCIGYTFFISRMGKQ